MPSFVASTPQRITRQIAPNNAPSGTGNDHTTPVGCGASRRKVIVIGDNTQTRPAKRPRRSKFETPKQTSTRVAEGSATPKTSQKSSRSTRPRVVTSGERADNQDDKLSDTSSEDDLTSGKKNATINSRQGLVHRNAFDAYFAAASKPSRTSNNVFSQLVRPLSPDEHTALLHSSDAISKDIAELTRVREAHEGLFPRYAFELAEGFNLLFFGFGSKRSLLNSFARNVCVPRGNVVIINAFQPRIGIREVLACIEEVPGLVDVPLARSGPEAQARRIYDFFLPPAVRPDHPTASRPLFLIIHNIDAPAMRLPRAKATLALLAMNPRIHLVASIDHIHAQTLWSTAEVSARKHFYVEGSTTVLPPTRGFAWAWHDMTTMQHYDVELAHVDVTRLIGKAYKDSAYIAERGMTETAAKHILASVNAKAKKLFALLGRTQLAAIEESNQNPKTTQTVSYTALFNAARADFIATNDTSFKALLAEFRDHKLVISNVERTGEMLGIPLQAEELRRLLEGLAAEA